MGKATRGVARRDWLPRYATSFLGRAGELAAIRTSFDRGARVVTLLGPGGIGKTRLAAEHATSELELGHQVRFADLTEAITEVGACCAVAVALDAALDRGTDATELVAEVGAALAALGPALVVLDNADPMSTHAAATLDEWLTAAPDARFLVTSRTRLATRAEATLDVGPLALAASGDAAVSDALRLFVDRARHARAGFVLAAEEHALAVEIVRRLDGWPLAIELAAARLSVLSLADLSRGLERRFELLRGATRDLPDRQRTLERTIRWSWELLTDAQREILVQCAVFREGFTLEAARAVLLAPNPNDADVLDLLESLRNQSLLRPEQPTDERLDMRLRLYESVREFALQVPGLEAVIAAARRRHAEHFASWGERSARTSGSTPEQRGARRRLSDALEDLLAAHRWALAATELPAAVRARLALACALGLGPVFSARGPNGPYLETFERALTFYETARGKKPDRDELERHARGLLGRAEARLRHGRVDDARRDLAAAEKLAKSQGDPALAATVSLALAGWGFVQGLLAETATHLRAALALAQKAGHRPHEARALDELTRVLLLRGELDEARETSAAARHLHRELGDTDGALRALYAEAEIAMDLGEVAEAERLHQEVVRRSRELDDPSTEAASLLSLAVLAEGAGRFDDAFALFDACIVRRRSVGVRGSESLAMAFRAACLERARRTSEARRAYEEAIRLAHASGNLLVEGLALSWLGRLEADADSVAAAETALQRASGPLESIADEVRGAIAEVCRCHLLLAKARACEATDPRAAAEMRAAVRAQLETLSEPLRGSRHSWDVATALAQLRAVMPTTVDEPGASGASTAALAVARSGKWFRFDGSDAVHIERHGAPSLIVSALARKRAVSPGVPATVDELFQAGWPGQRAHPRSVAGRVYTAVATLRRLGLRDVLLRHHDGYLFDASVAVRVADEE